MSSEKEFSDVTVHASHPSEYKYDAIYSGEKELDSSHDVTFNIDDKVENDTNEEELDEFAVDDEADPYNDEWGYVEPTEEEMATLKHVAGHIPYRCWLIAVVELSERFSYYGLSAPFQNYMANGPNDTPKGILQLNTNGATGLSYFFQFWCYITPIFGGYMADTYWNKYNTIAVGTVIYIIGIFILFITAIPSIATKETATGGFVTAIILIGIGTGMIKANLSVLVAEQIPKRKHRVITTKKGERVIEDPDITMQNVFMFFYLMINIGALSVLATTELESHKGFWAAYLLPFCFFWIAVVILVMGRNSYIIKPVGDKVISKCFKVTFIVCKNKFNFDSAKPSLNPEMQYPWSDKFVDEINRSIKACKVFIFYPIYWCVYGQMINNFITQAGTMELHNIPNDFLQVFDSIGIIVFIPIFERFVYPTIRRFTPLKPITKIFLGFMCGSCAMVWAAVLQSFIYKAGPCYDHPMACGPEYTNIPNRVHVAWQIPAYVIIAWSEIFASVTGLEFAYSNAPDSMKAFIMSIFLFTNAIGAALGVAISPTSVDPKYTWVFTGLAVSCFVAGCLFWICFHHYNDIDADMKAIDFVEDDMINASGDVEKTASSGFSTVEPIISMRSAKSL
ncbi:hypothetical protein TPHA_0O02000 [Tetrapisispora phaffii CBS 4417]|uniref:Peptide transporter PTR2 n=1 Tax=Tetrapisispora phaffii (strain ATCC 24235 / CBS 4417 / NBRC 1672 / NRRL Y-8282 / UCD 70-5) TaxID=1071381 RepID=G8C1Y8_TETPH|nr:hypothetical protein TPHA_0O02000 [Tetrapisispora phaffii CBS 4417]CCE66166.1 hypothetical protein TPHA_0O02000 [Tetrapisispora phaffii CBS 4417]